MPLFRRRRDRDERSPPLKSPLAAPSPILYCTPDGSETDVYATASTSSLHPSNNRIEKVRQLSQSPRSEHSLPFFFSAAACFEREGVTRLFPPSLSSLFHLSFISLSTSSLSPSLSKKTKTKTKTNPRSSPSWAPSPDPASSSSAPASAASRAPWPPRTSAGPPRCSRSTSCPT